MSKTSVQLPSYLQSGMVLQQHASTMIRGSYRPRVDLYMTLVREPADSARATHQEQSETVHSDRCTCDDHGGFELFLPALSASDQSYTICFSEDAEGRKVLVELVDILIGEVWVTGGQGNMEMPLYATGAGADRDLLLGNNHIRFLVQDAFGVDPQKGRFSFEPTDRLSGSFWTAPGDRDILSHVSSLSAHFALALQTALRVPIGIIDTALAESMVHTWVDRQTLNHSPDYVNLLRERGLWCRKEEWESSSRNSLRQPSVFFNHKIAPLKDLVVRGFFLALGESEIGDERFFAKGFSLLLTSWKTVFCPVPGCPIYTIYTGPAQASYPSLAPNALAKFNLLLARLRPRLGEEVSYVATFDLAPEWQAAPVEWRNPRYPQNKATWGQRAAKLALGLAYRRRYPVTSPEVAKVKRIDNKLVLSFRFLEQNLTLPSGEKRLCGFSLCGDDGVYREAQTKLLYGREVMLWHPDVAVPRQAAYAYSHLAVEANLCTEDGLAVAPFATAKEPGLSAVACGWAECDRLHTWGVRPFLENLETQRESETSIRRLTSAVVPGATDAAPLAKGATDHRLYPGNVLGAEELPQWRSQTEADVRLRLEEVNFRSGQAALEVNYAGPTADLAILSPQLDACSMRPRLNLKNFLRLEAWVFNPDGRDKDICLEGGSGWQRLPADLQWQRFVFDLTPLHRQNINQICFRILDKMQVGIVLFDQFTLYRIPQTAYESMEPPLPPVKINTKQEAATLADGARGIRPVQIKVLSATEKEQE